jgi:Ca2+-binding EF-hand superfamily protein
VWHDIISEVDIDGNGEIDFQEFSIMMQKLISDDKKSAKAELLNSQGKSGGG